jgi:MoxR-like ATPase
MDELRRQLALRIVGMEDVVDHALVCLLCNVHGLLVGVPGLAKTLLCASIAELLDLQFKRIQFTPDLMPGDIVGTETLVEMPEGGRGFRFVHGPIFTNLLLADEINRTPPKTQAALMEAMEEGTVTSAGTRRDLDPPFIVLATQNPIEQEGTYELPAAQLDRFLVRIPVDYPDEVDEKEVVRRTTAGEVAELEPVLSRDEILALQALVRDEDAPADVLRYATTLARATRPGDEAPAGLGDLIAWGAGPRAAQALVMASKARALMDGRSRPSCDDVRAVLPAVMGHRVIPSFTAAARDVTTDEIVRRIVAAIPAPDGWSPAPDEPEDGFFAGILRRFRGRAASATSA